MKALDISDLVGRVFTGVNVAACSVDDVSVYVSLYAHDACVYFGHVQQCCESVGLDEVHGDTMDLVGSPVLKATLETGGAEDDNGTSSWAFYHIATMKGYVTFRFGGSSNGYYSEEVCIYENRGNQSTRPF